MIIQPPPLADKRASGIRSNSDRPTCTPTASMAASSRDLFPTATIDKACREVLDLLRTGNYPLTLVQISRRVTVPREDLPSVLEALCTAGTVRRLNTIVESYAAAVAPLP